MRLQKRMDRILAVVSTQAEDEKLWFVAKYITESGLQSALRDLHRVIENDQ